MFSFLRQHEIENVENFGKFAGNLQPSEKRCSNKDVSLWISWNFLEQLLPWGDCFVTLIQNFQVSKTCCER